MPSKAPSLLCAGRGRFALPTPFAYPLNRFSCFTKDLQHTMKQKPDPVPAPKPHRNRACIECPEVYFGPLSCPKCGAPGEPLNGRSHISRTVERLLEASKLDSTP